MDKIGIFGLVAVITWWVKNFAKVRERTSGPAYGKASVLTLTSVERESQLTRTGKDRLKEV